MSHFIEKYWRQERPVIIENVSIENYNFSKEEIKKKFQNEKDKQIGWYDAKVTSELTPDFVAELLSRDDISTREKPMRIFMQPGGHRTFAHYDGNSIHGLNYQFKGSKEWIIISPNTPYSLIPFMYVVMNKEIATVPDHIDHYRFTMKEGDLLFLPRYWQHQVNSLAKVNINFNWVMTPLLPNQTRLGKREQEIIKLRKALPIINKAFFPEPINKYGGQGYTMVDAYTRDLSKFSILARLFKEVFNYIPFLFYYKNIKTRADLFKKNNFNV